MARSRVSKQVKILVSRRPPSCFGLAVAATLALSAFSGIQHEAQQALVRMGEAETKRIVSWVAQVGSAARRVLGPESADGQEFRRLVADAPKGSADPLMDTALLEFRAKSCRVTGDKEGYLREKAALDANAIIIPELFKYELRAPFGPGEGTPEERMRATEAYGACVPFSISGRARDSRPAPAGLIDPGPPWVPNLRGLAETLEKIGALYARAGLLREAVDSYVESVHAQPGVAPGPEMAERWMRIGQCEAILGRRMLAIRAYLNAAYSDEARSQAVCEALTRPTDVKAGPAATGASALSSDMALQIAALYRSANLHPLALQVLSEARGVSGEKVAAERRLVEKEWSGITEKHVRIRGPNAVLLGQKIVDVKDWATAPISRPSTTFWREPTTATGAPKQ